MTFRYGETVHKKGAQARDYSFLGVLLGWLLFTASPRLRAEFYYFRERFATTPTIVVLVSCFSALGGGVSSSIENVRANSWGTASSEQRVQPEISKTGLDEILYSRLHVLAAERAVRTR